MNDLETVSQFKTQLQQADAILIGASNGLSVAEGANYYRPGAWFQQHLAPFQQRYGFTNVLDATNYPFKTPSELWSFQLAVALASTFNVTAAPVSAKLHQLVADKPHFVLTTLVDNHLEMGGFNSQNIFEVEGNYQRLQRADGQRNQTWPAERVIRTMAAHAQNNQVMAADLPHDPADGALLVPAVGQVVQDGTFMAQQTAFQTFVQTHQQDHLVLLEVGVGPRHPVIQPTFTQIQQSFPHVTRLSLNMTLPTNVDGGLTGDIDASLDQLAAVNN